jgi:hypothetical protein
LFNLLAQVVKEKARYEKEMENYEPPEGFEDSGSKGRGKKKKKDPNAPKRAVTSYMLYYSKMRPIIKEQNPDIKFTEMGKLVGKKWGELSSEGQKEFIVLAEKDKQRYSDEMAKYKIKKEAEADGMDDDQDDDDDSDDDN